MYSMYVFSFMIFIVFLTFDLMCSIVTAAVVLNEVVSLHIEIDL